MIGSLIYLTASRPDITFVVGVCVGTKGVSHNHHLSFDDHKVLKLSIGYAKYLFKCAGP